MPSRRGCREKTTGTRPPARPRLAAPSPAMTAWRARISASTAPPKKTRHAMAAYLRGAAGAGAAAPGPPVRMVLKKVLLGSSTITSLLLLKLR